MAGFDKDDAWDMLKNSVTVRLNGGAVFCSRPGETIRSFATRITQRRIVATTLLQRCDNGGTQSLQDAAQALVDEAFDEGDARSKLMGMDIGRVHISRLPIAGESHVVVELPEGTTVKFPIGSNSPDEAEHDAAALAVLAYELAVAIGPNGVTQRCTTVVPQETMFLEKRVRVKKQYQ